MDVSPSYDLLSHFVIHLVLHGIGLETNFTLDLNSSLSYWLSFGRILNGSLTIWTHSLGSSDVPILGIVITNT